MGILSGDSTLVLKAVATGTGPNLPGAAEWIRQCFLPELAAAILTQVALRRRAQEKLPMADWISFTPDGLKQATH